MPCGPKDHGHKAGIDFSANILTGQDEGASHLVWIQSRGTLFLPCKMKIFLEESQVWRVVLSMFLGNQGLLINKAYSW